MASVDSKKRAATELTAGSDSAATERTETTAVLYLEHYDVCDRPTRGHVATEHICIGSCVLHWSNASDLEVGIPAHLDLSLIHI